ncbi:MAG TPA: hypothetical protein VJM34_13765 [Novosphingobium sp.]|nr:hypothetical protein [Novosphingobium sp.]
MKATTSFLAVLALLPGVAIAQSRHEQDPMVSIYASDYGVTEAEASRRLGYTDDAVNLKQAAEAKFPDTFGGLYIQHKPSYQIIVKFSRDAEASLRSLTVDPTFAAVKSEHSIRDLEQKASQVESVLKGKGIECRATVNSKDSVVVVWLDKSQLDIARTKLIDEGIELSAIKIVPYGEIELTKGS